MISARKRVEGKSGYYDGLNIYIYTVIPYGQQNLYSVGKRIEVISLAKLTTFNLKIK